jgi:hypothetical protein
MDEFETPSDAELEAEAMSQPAEEPELAAVANATDEPVDDDLLDKMRGMGVGTEDPNIVGDAGPTDVPPGADPPEERDPEA